MHNKYDYLRKVYFSLFLVLANKHVAFSLVFELAFLQFSLYAISLFADLPDEIHTNNVTVEISQSEIEHIQRLGLDKPECINIEEFDVYLDNTENI